MRLKPTPLLALAGAISLGWLSLAHADDTEIYVNPASTIRPNILFIIDTSDSMNTLEAIDNPATPNPSDSIEMSRLDIVKDVAKKLAAELSGVNIGLMRFDSQAQGGYVTLPMADIETHRAAFNNALDSYPASGSSPLAETLYEAYLYYNGKAVKYGQTSQPGASVAGSQIDGIYISPITHVCQKNFIIYLTAGEPTADTDANALIQALTGKKCTGDGECLKPLAQYLYETDQSKLPQPQNVTTYTVGFHADQKLLSDTATAGGGKYYVASDYEALQTALGSIFEDIQQHSGLYAAPALAVNAFNHTEHLDQLYFSVFQAANTPRWNGNIKRYRFDGVTGTLVDSQGKPAMDPATGSFHKNATSYWSTAPDGDQVVLGGAANKLTLARNAYTYAGTYTGETALQSPNSRLASADNTLSENNALITSTMLGNSGLNDDNRSKILQWARGVDVLDENKNGNRTDARNRLEDPLHSSPQLINYGGTKENPDLTLYTITNGGKLHAINAQTGVELFSFTPQEVLPRLPTWLDNKAGHAKVYGLDGPLSAHVINNAGLSIQPAENDKIIFYFGMRRGGRSYFALDVTNRSDPILKWAIKPTSSGTYSEMGQSWSKPTPARVNMGGTIKNVLIFAGGYDSKNDSGATRTPDNSGRAIYLIDANTGAMLWSGGTTRTRGETFTQTFTEMNHSIPSDIRVIDINLDGLADQLYVGDMGGQLWRFDITQGQSGRDLITGGVIFAANDGTLAGNRRFYYPPSISLQKDTAGLTYLAVAAGSGWREHPLDQVVQDRISVIRQPVAYSGSYPRLSAGDLYDATANLIGQGADAQKTAAAADLARAQGWYIQLGHAGEKMLSEALIINSQLAFTTYQPSPPLADSCLSNAGTGRFYLISMVDGAPTRNLSTRRTEGQHDTCGTMPCDADDRSVKLTAEGIPAPPAALFINNQIHVLVGAEQPVRNAPNDSSLWGRIIQRSFWREATSP